MRIMIKLSYQYNSAMRSGFRWSLEKPTKWKALQGHVPNDTFSGGFNHGQIESHLGWWFETTNEVNLQQRYLWRASTSLWRNCCSKVMLWSPWSQLLGSNVADVDVTMDMSIFLFQSFQRLVGPRDVLVCCQVHTWARKCVPLCACAAPACENEKHRCKYMTEPIQLVPCFTISSWEGDSLSWIHSQYFPVDSWHWPAWFSWSRVVKSSMERVCWEPLRPTRHWLRLLGAERAKSSHGNRSWSRCEEFFGVHS